MTHNNNRTTTIRYLLITSGVLAIGGLGYLAYTMLHERNEVRYYESEQQCIVDAMNQSNGFTKEQCQAQFRYAMQEYERITPVYRTQPECQEDTASICSQVSNSSAATPGWRPEFGGFYFTDDVDDDAPPTVVNGVNGGSYTVYPVQPVYRSNIGIVTPDRTQITRPLQGIPLDSPYFSSSGDTPNRPAGHAAQGTIKGRGRFGSTVRSTAPLGSGGK
ncbi:MULTISPECIES: DUF1190 domain-containing protein [unclassified Microcoleus]|uniref:DUF1190 domain-containing protein n=1 Tax=unclassified Microcoleus TaxID=2642155 RepID=UPI002FD5CC81